MTFLVLSLLKIQCVTSTSVCNYILLPWNPGRSTGQFILSLMSNRYRDFVWITTDEDNPDSQKYTVAIKVKNFVTLNRQFANKSSSI